MEPVKLAWSGRARQVEHWEEEEEEEEEEESRVFLFLKKLKEEKKMEEKESIKAAAEEVSLQFKTLMNSEEVDSLKQLQHLM